MEKNQDKYNIIKTKNGIVVKNNISGTEYKVGIDCIESMLNDIDDKNRKIKDLENRIEIMEDDNNKYSLSVLRVKKREEERFKVTECPYEVLDTQYNRYFWLELRDNITAFCFIVNDINNTLDDFMDITNELRLTTTDENLKRKAEDMLEHMEYFDVH